MSLLASFCDDPAAQQAPADVAVVIPTLLRGTLAEALESVFAQRFPGRIQVLVGIDQAAGPAALVEETCRRRPSHVSVLLLDPGYSTSVRHGGLCAARDGGVLRCVLSHLANAPFVAYLDDDNRFLPDHLHGLRSGIGRHAAHWGFSLRWFAHHRTMRPVCIDQWESVGPDAGIFRDSFGGFVDPNCLMLDKRACEDVLAAWLRPLPGDPKGMSADRSVFALLRHGRPAIGTGAATTLYRLDPQDELHATRLRLMGDAYAAAG